MTEEIRIAVVVNPGLAVGALANTVGAIAIGLGATVPALAGLRLSDREGRTIDISANRPVPVLQADASTLRVVLQKALAQPEGAIVPFPAFARALHLFADYQAALPALDLLAEPMDGVGLAGPARWVRSLTGSLKLLR